MINMKNKKHISVSVPKPLVEFIDFLNKIGQALSRHAFIKQAIYEELTEMNEVLYILEREGIMGDTEE